MQEELEVAVEARNVSIKNSHNPFIEKLSFQAKSGECLGFLGPVGAGKTTLMKALFCQKTIDSGSLFINGLNSQDRARQVKEMIGVVPSVACFDEDFSVFDNLIVFANYFQRHRRRSEERARGLLREMEIDDLADESVVSLSLAEQKKLMICRALLVEPKVLFADEPTKGLGEADRRWIWKLLRKLCDQVGMTVVLATQEREEIEEICDRVVLLDRGKALEVGAPNELVKTIVGPEVLEFLCKKTDLDYYLSRLQGQYSFQVIKDHVRLFLRENQEAKTAMSYVASEKMTIRRASLDDVYLKLTGHDLGGLP